MRPIAIDQNPLRYPLNALFNTPANVRLLRLLADGLSEPIGAVDAAERCGLSVAGARRALTKLAKTGFVERIGTGYSQQYALRDSDPLDGAIRALFQCERERHQQLIVDVRSALKPLTEIQAVWFDLTEPPNDATLHIGVLSDTRSLTYLGEQVRQRLNPLEREFDVTIEVRTSSRADLPEFGPDDIQMIHGYLEHNGTGATGTAGTHEDKDRRALYFSQAIAELLDTDPALLVRATRYLDMVLLGDSGTAEHDLLEWRNILAHYSKKRLRDFLVSDTQRAQRLRQSSPFFAALTLKQRDRILTDSDHDNDA